jgi:hypothetical protein
VGVAGGPAFACRRWGGLIVVDPTPAQKHPAPVPKMRTGAHKLSSILRSSLFISRRF